MKPVTFINDKGQPLQFIADAGIEWFLGGILFLVVFGVITSVALIRKDIRENKNDRNTSS